MPTNYFLVRAKRIKNIYYLVIAIIVAQILYFPANYKYLHLPLMFLTLITVDLYEFKYRNYSDEYKILGSLLFCAIIAILDKYVNLDLKVLYYCFLTIGIYFNFKLMNNTKKIFSLKSEKKQINSRNKKLFKGNGKFMQGYCVIIQIVLLTTMVYIIMDIMGLVRF